MRNDPDGLVFKEVNRDLFGVYVRNDQSAGETLIGHVRRALDGTWVAQLNPTHRMRLSAALHLMAVHLAMKGR